MTKLLLLGLFSGAIWDILGKTSTFGALILAILAIMSVISWSIIFKKWQSFKGVTGENETFRNQFKRSKNLSDVAGQAKTLKKSVFSAIYRAGMSELTQLRELRNEAGGLRDQKASLLNEDFEIIEMSMERASTEEFVRLEKQTIFLATTASAAPFMGLLGTVVGIMDAFWSIGEQGSASLAVVAPGIAEALLATIVGLGAAIPAVIGFNWANNMTKRMNDRAYSFILAFMARARKEEI